MKLEKTMTRMTHCSPFMKDAWADTDKHFGQGKDRWEQTGTVD